MAESEDISMTALDEAIRVCNGVGAFATAISTAELPVGQSKVSMWKTRRKVPPEYVPAIYRETLRRGQPVECERLAPQVDWAVLREQVSPSDVAGVVGESRSCHGGGPTLFGAEV